MANRKDEGAKGKIQFKSYFYESPSGHVEESNDIFLEAKDENTLILSEDDSSLNVFKKSRDKNHIEKYEIDVNSLIKLIKENGTKI